MNEKDLERELAEGVYKARPLLKAIKLKCLDCCGGCWKEVQECTSNDTCFLHPYRLGKNPLKKRKYSPEYTEVLRERLQRAREISKYTSKD